MILTGQELTEDGIGHLTCHSFPKLTPKSKGFCPTQPLLAKEKVRYVGEGVALIIGETREKAADAAELLIVEYEILPAVTLVDAHVEGAPKVWTIVAICVWVFNLGA